MPGQQKPAAISHSGGIRWTSFRLRDAVVRGSSAYARSFVAAQGVCFLYLTQLAKVIQTNREQFSDLFLFNDQVDDHFSPLIGLRNILAHSKEAFLPGKLRTSGESEVCWFAEKLGMELDIVPPVRVMGDR